jgi:Tol biopolymer transport system component
MVTGTRPFTGDSKLSILATILQKDPRPAGDAAQGIPHELDKIINRCLQKDPQERWQTMADVKFALQDLLADLESNYAPEASRVAVPPVSQKRLWWAAPIFAVVAVAGAYIGIHYRYAEPPSYQRLTFRRGDVSSARFAPDGQTIVYSAAWDGARTQIYTTIAGSHGSRPLDVPEGRLLALSSKGEIAFLHGGASGVLARVPLAGGAPRDVLENVLDADWSPDGSQLAVVRVVEGRSRLEYPIGHVIYESDKRPPLSPRVSPNGASIAFYEYDPVAGDYSVVLIGTDSPKRVLSAGWRGISDHLAWRPQGNEVWFAATHLSGDPMLRAVNLTGRVRTVGQIPGWLTIQDIAPDGRLLLTSATSRMAITFSPSGGVERDLSWLDTSRVMQLSDDAKQMLFLELSYGEGQNTSIYLRNTDGSPAILLGYGNHPALSPDGKWVAAITRGPANKSDLILLPTGAGEQRNLTTPGLHYDSVEWFPSGDKLLFTATNAAGHPVTYVQSVSGGPPRPVIKPGVRGERVSRDGSSLVGMDGGHYQIFPLDGGASRPIPGIQPGDRPLRWAADGASLFVQRNANGDPKFQIYRINVSTGKRELWKEIGPADPVGAQMVGIAITPDGKSYAYSYQRDTSNLYLVNGLR